MGRTVKTITADQTEKLLTHIATNWTTDRNYNIANRNYLITLLMLDTGIRVGELVQLVRADLVTNGQPVQTLVIRNEIAKRHHERTIPTSKRIRSGIEMFTVKAWFSSENPNTTPAFHRHHNYKALSTRQIENIIGKAAEESIGEWIHPHCLRHTFASRLMRTTNIRIVQELLGHKNLSSTQIYTHPNSNDLRKAIDSITN